MHKNVGNVTKLTLIGVAICFDAFDKLTNWFLQNNEYKDGYVIRLFIYCSSSSDGY